jgi:hypothetical protein
MEGTFIGAKLLFAVEQKVADKFTEGAGKDSSSCD